jgi:hypothetical protein
MHSVKSVYYNYRGGKMKYLILLLLIVNVSASANEISCKLNGKEIELNHHYTCFETEDEVYHSVDEVFEMISRKYPDENASLAFRWACRYLDRHGSFSLNDEKFVVSYSISVNQFRPSDDFMYVKSLSLKSNKRDYASNTVYSGDVRISDLITMSEDDLSVLDCQAE